jgi:hypothetical protein
MTTRRCSLHPLFCRYDISQLSPQFRQKSWGRAASAIMEQ